MNIAIKVLKPTVEEIELLLDSAGINNRRFGVNNMESNTSRIKMRCQMGKIYKDKECDNVIFVNKPNSIVKHVCSECARALGLSSVEQLQAS